jgi:hypothetical protein
VFQFLTEFFGQSGEKIGLCAKKISPSKMKFWGLFALKTWEKFGGRILGPPFVFRALLEERGRIYG